MSAPFTLSIVVPVYFNEASLPEAVPALLALEPQIPGARLELIFVNDGSGDRSLDLLLDFRARHPGVIKIVSLTRNFGVNAALEAGFARATGDCLAGIAADLQDPPELLTELVAAWRAGAKSVYAVRETRDDPFATRLFAACYYRLLRSVLPDFPAGGFSCFLLDRQVVAAYLRLGERNVNVCTQLHWLGFRPACVPYARRARTRGRSRWTFFRKLRFFADTFLSLTYAPLRLATLGGIAAALGALLFGLWRIVIWWKLGVEVKGFTTLALLITFFGGVQMMTLGIIGEYLWHTLAEARKRPSHIVDRVWE